MDMYNPSVTAKGSIPESVSRWSTRVRTCGYASNGALYRYCSSHPVLTLDYSRLNRDRRSGALPAILLVWSNCRRMTVLLYLAEPEIGHLAWSLVVAYPGMCTKKPLPLRWERIADDILASVVLFDLLGRVICGNNGIA